MSTACGSFIPSLGSSNNEVEFFLVDTATCLVGDLLGNQVVLKTASIGPAIGTAVGLYRNYAGICKNNPVKCFNDDPCTGGGNICEEATPPLPAAVTATVLDANGEIRFKAKQSVTFEPAKHSAYAVDLGLTEHVKVIDSIVHHQFVQVGDTVDVLDYVAPLLGLGAAPNSNLYAPRFIFYPEQPADDIFGKGKNLMEFKAKDFNPTIETGGTRITMKIKNDEFGVIDLIQPAGAGGTMTAITEGTRQPSVEACMESVFRWEL